LIKVFTAVTACSVLLATACSGHSAAAVALTNQSGGACMTAPTPADWAKLLHQPTEFGLDYFTINTSQAVRVQSVDLIGGTGGLRVVNVAFVPGGGVGVFDYLGDSRDYGPAAFRNRIMMPGAVLPRIQSSEAELADNTSADDYQLVVAVLPTKEFASAQLARITFRVGNHIEMVTGRQFVSVARGTPPTCSPSSPKSTYG
jgi:hypothetical protein